MTFVMISVGKSTIATTPSAMSIENSQIVDTKIMMTVEVANGIGPRTATDAFGVDAGALDEVAVGAPGVPAERLPDEATDHLVRVASGRPATGRSRQSDRRTTTPIARRMPMPITIAMPAITELAATAAVLEARQDHMIDHPADREAGGDRADREHGGATDGDEERLRVDADQRRDETDVAPEVAPFGRGGAVAV